MIFKYDCQNLNFNQLITELVFSDAKKNIPSDECNLDTIHKYFSNDEIPVLVQKIYSLFKSKKFQ